MWPLLGRKRSTREAYSIEVQQQMLPWSNVKVVPILRSKVDEMTLRDELLREALNKAAV